MALRGQPVDDRRDARGCRAQHACTFEKARLLHLRIVEVAEQALQFLQGGENDLEIGCCVEAGRDVYEVT